MSLSRQNTHPNNQFSLDNFCVYAHVYTHGIVSCSAGWGFHCCWRSGCELFVLVAGYEVRSMWPRYHQQLRWLCFSLARLRFSLHGHISEQPSSAFLLQGGYVDDAKLTSPLLSLKLVLSIFFSIIPIYPQYTTVVSMFFSFVSI